MGVVMQTFPKTTSIRVRQWDHNVGVGSWAAAEELLGVVTSYLELSASRVSSVDSEGPGADKGRCEAQGEWKTRCRGSAWASSGDRKDNRKRVVAKERKGERWDCKDH